VQPFIALARALSGRRHEVTLAGPHRFAEFARQQGVGFVPLAGDPEEISRRINDAGADPIRMAIKMRDYVQSIAGEVALAAFSSCEQADLIIHSFLFTTGAHSLARQMGIPDISVQLFPVFLPTREFPNVAVPHIPAGPLSYFSHWMANQIFWYGGNSSYKRLRAQYGASLPRSLHWPFKGPSDKWRTLLLGAWSPSVLPRPKDWPISAVEVTGYWYLEASEKYLPPSELVDFLAAGEPPICVSFGSMIHRRAGKIMEDLMEALSRSGERVVVLTGWQAWAAQPGENMLLLPEVSHDWLFPRSRMVVHHGGAGTAAAVVRAGVPSVVIPFAADQLFWARRLGALEVAPQAVRVEKLSVPWLVEALKEAKAGAVMDRAAQLGVRVRGENGLEQAMHLIENWAEGRNW
jgi:sterol 3beta-glucosyltransferase